MASRRRDERPPLQLQFTEQGGKRVLPLNTENVSAVFKTGVLSTRRSKYGSTFGQRLGIPESIKDPLSAATWWVGQGKDRRWRVIIYYLDRVRETGLADQLLRYSEPPSDPSLTAARVTSILMELEKWRSTGDFTCGAIILVPANRSDIIRSQHTSTDDQKREAATYYVAYSPSASWGHLAKGLYQAGEKRAIEAFKAQLPKPKESTLTVDTMMTATEGMQLAKESFLDNYLDMPNDTYNGIVRRKGTGRKGREAVFAEFLSHHPYPTWEVVIELLETLESERETRAGLAQEVKEKYLTMSDEKAQEIVDRALEDGSLKQYYSISVVTGINESGKSCLISRLFHQIPPDLYTSTGIADRSCRGLAYFMGSLGLDAWKMLSSKDFLQLLVQRLSAGMFNAITSSHSAALLETESAGSSLAPTLSSSPTPPTPDISTPSPSLSHSTTSQKVPPLPKRSHTSETLIRLVRETKGSEHSLAVQLLHLIDTGGQPEFLEVIPSLIHNSNLTALVINLAQSLDTCPEIAFYVDSNACKRPLPSTLTNRQIAHQVAHTMMAKRSSGGKRSKLIVVGTHRDCVKGELSTTLAAVNKALKKIFLPSLENELIVYRSPKEIVFPVNSIHPDDDDNVVFESIRSRISEAGADEESDTPISFFVFEQDAMKFANQLGRKVLSLDECVQVGGILQMSQEVVKAALIYFHQRNIFVHFQHVLPDIVFTNPQVPLDLFKAIVVFSYKAQSGDISGLPAKYSALLKRGMISEEMLQHDSFNKCFIPGIYEPQHAIKLFSHLYTIAPLSEEEPSANSQQPPPAHSSEVKQKPSRLGTGEYLMMSLLAPLPEEKVKEVLNTPSKVATLLIHFSTECIPNGCFSSTIACAISEYNWTICYSDISQSKPECVAHNGVTLLPRNHPGKVTLVNSTHYLQIHVDTTNVKERHLNDLCRKVQTTVFAALTKVFEKMHFVEIEVQPAFLCPCGPSSEPHAATICPEPPVTTDSYLVCSRTGTVIGDLEWRQQVWFEGCKEERMNTHIHRDQRPTLSQLKLLKCPSGERVEIITSIAADWKDFGILLDFDETGRTIDRIAREHQLRPIDCCTQMMKEWLEGKGRQPATWATLIDLLKDAESNGLAQQLERIVL